MGNGVYAYLGYGVTLDYEGIQKLPWDSIGDSADYGEEKPSFDDWTHSISPLGSQYDFSLPNWDHRVWSQRPGNILDETEFWKLGRLMEETLPITQRVLDFNDSQVILAIQGTLTQASWGEPTKPVMTVSEEQLSAAKEFCERYSIPFENPEWFLVAKADY